MAVRGGSEIFKPWNIVYCNFPYEDGKLPPKPHYAILLATRVLDGRPMGTFVYTTSGAKKEDNRVPFYEIRVKDDEALKSGLPKGFEIHCQTVKEIPLTPKWVPELLKEVHGGARQHLPRHLQDRMWAVFEILAKADERGPHRRALDLMKQRRAKSDLER